MRSIPYVFVMAVLFSHLLSGQSFNGAASDSLKRHYYEVVFPKLSPDGRYVAFNKSYDTQSDTVVVVERQYPQRVLFEKGGVPAFTVSFTSDNTLLMRQGKVAKVLFLSSGRVREWQNVSVSFYHTVLRQMMLLQNGTLKILDGEGNEMKSIPNVTDLKNEKSSVYYTVRKGNSYDLTEWDGRKDTVLHSSENSGLVVLQKDKDGILILEQTPVSAEKELVFRKDNTVVRLKDSYDGIVSTAEVSKMARQGYFLHLYGLAPPPETGAADLWYGNDRKISMKFYGDYVGKFFLWNPVNGHLEEVKDERLTHHANIGHPRYLLSFDPFFTHDYTKKFKTFNLYRYDTLLKNYEFIVNSGTTVICNESGQLLLTYHEGPNWELYDLATLKHRTISVPEHENAYFAENGKHILFEGIGKLYQYDLASGKINVIPTKPGFRARIKNTSITYVAGEFNIIRQTYSIDQPLFIDLYDRDNIRSAWVSFDGRAIKTVIEPTGDDLTEVSWKKMRNNILYVKSNINKTPQLLIKKGNTETVLYTSNKKDTEAGGIKSEIIDFRNSKGVALKGVLIYPVAYKPGIKYPMVVTVYQKLRYNMNKYLIDGIGMVSPTEGINIRTLLRKGYMVYMPDIVFDERGTGVAALDCVNNAMDALQGNPSVDFKRVALVGHSHGGYETNFIATQSNRFATYVSGAGNSDLVRSYHSFNYDFQRPFFWQYEDGQYEMPGRFTNYKALYVNNSPIYHAEKVTRPMLLWTGMKDYNIFWEQTMEFYMGLRRSQKPVIALFYPDDGHSFMKTKNRVDLYSRIYEWLDYHLKSRPSIWIQKMYE